MNGDNLITSWDRVLPTAVDKRWSLGTRPLDLWATWHSAIAGLFKNAFDLLLVWQARRADRRALMAMDDHLLKDIGISRSDAVSEWNKPFWRM